MIRPRAEFAVLALAAVLALCAVTVLAVRSVEHTRTTVVTSVQPLPRVSADDCPLGVTCVDGSPRAVVAQLLRSAFPDADVVEAFALHGSDPTRPYRETVLARTSTGVGVAITMRRLEGGARVGETVPASAPSVGPATVAVVIPGAAGCSVAVVLDVPAGVLVPTAAAEQLARQSRLQLRC